MEQFYGRPQNEDCGWNRGGVMDQFCGTQSEYVDKASSYPHVSSIGRIQNSYGYRQYLPATCHGYGVIQMKAHGRKITVPVHRAVHILFNDPLLGEFEEGMTVDHINGDRIDNHVENLRWATLKQQRENQADPFNPFLNTQPVDLEKDGLVRSFDSIKKAAEFLEVAQINLKSLDSTNPSIRGWTIRLKESPDLEGEVWVPAIGLSSTVRVSNLNRICYRGFKRTPGNGNKPYVMVGGVLFAHTVLESFGFPRPSTDYTSDHIDRNPFNNSLDNLRWATAAEQAENRKKKAPRACRIVEYRKVGDQDWILGESQGDVQALTGISQRNMSKCLHPAQNRRTATGKNNVVYEIRCYVDPLQNDLPGEVWKPIVPEDWDYGGKYCLHDKATPKLLKKRPVHVKVGRKYQSRIVGETSWKTHKSVNEAAAATGVSKKRIYGCCQPSPDRSSTYNGADVHYEFRAVKNDLDLEEHDDVPPMKKQAVVSMQDE
jgi:hypothetical protein